MTSSDSSSTRRLAWCAAAFAAATIAACGHAPRPPERSASAKLAIFPVQNASGGTAPIRRLTEALDATLGMELGAHGLAIIPRADLDAALATHRLRFTGGVDRTMAKVLRELGVDAVLVPTLELYAAETPPRISVAVRLVGTQDRPTVLWADAVSRSGDDAPGLLGLGLVASAAELERRVVAAISRSVERYLTTGDAGGPCDEAGRFVPRRAFRAPMLDDVGRRSVAVLPFTNEASRRSAGDVLLGQFIAQLARSGSFEVLDPGFVREELLGHRVVLEGGVSLDHAMALLDELDADLVLSGYVQLYESPPGRHAPPRIEFTAYMIDGLTGELVWSSTSTGAGDDGVFFFGAGRVHTTSTLSCRMVRGVVDRIVGRRGPLGPAEYAVRPRPSQTLRYPWGWRSSRAGQPAKPGETPPDSAGFRPNRRAQPMNLSRTPGEAPSTEEARP